MKAIILAAGIGNRMRPLTATTPKTLLKVNNKPIIDYIFDSLPLEIDEVIVVVKYLSSQIRKYLGKRYKGKNIYYAKGSDKGSAYSFLAAKKYINNERFILIYGDEIPYEDDIRRCLSKELSVLTFKSPQNTLHGIVCLRKDNSIDKISEKPSYNKESFSVDGIMVLNSEIFDYVPYLEKGEFYLTSLINLFSQKRKIYSVPSKNFIGDLTTPKDIVRVERLIKKRKKK